jgi:parallel beta-helix repeat protein
MCKIVVNFLMRKFILLFTVLVFISSPLWANNYFVTNCNDSGAGSLRLALDTANANGAASHTISFNIPSGTASAPNETSGGKVTSGTDVYYRIVTSTPLSITHDSVSLLGNSQTTFGGSTNSKGREIEIRANGTFDVFDISGDDVTIQSVVINRCGGSNGGNGIDFIGGDNGRVWACSIGGLTATGESLSPNTHNYGIYSSSAGGHFIGGVSANIISANSVYGIRLANSANNTITKNYIGFAPDGETARPNGVTGIWVYGSTSQNNVIGSSESGGGNLIMPSDAFNGNGIYFVTGAQYNYVYNNKIGVTLSWATPSIRGNTGIFISGAHRNDIGGTGSYQPNFISNNVEGIRLSGSSYNKIFGNQIGVDGGNGDYGIRIDGLSSYNYVGTSESGGGNVIIASSESSSIGLYISGSSADDNYIYNNIIGLTGAQALPASQGWYGIVLTGNTDNNYIGGTAANEGNVISGNKFSGIQLDSASSNKIFGNYIGFKSDGETLRSNRIYGIDVRGNSQNNIIGTSEGSGGNLIIATGESYSTGIVFYGSDVENNHIYNNIIGLTGSSATPSAQQVHGISFQSGANNNQIGGPGANEGNVISGNAGHGINFTGTSEAVATSNNKIFGNIIGFAANGETVRANESYGIYFYTACQYNLIGTSESGGGNLIVAEPTRDGIHFFGSDIKYNRIYNNIIGLTASGAIPSAQGSEGIQFEAGVTDNQIGGINPNEGNVISGSTIAGIYLVNTASNNKIFGNIVGFAPDGETVRANGTYGMRIASSGNIIGTLEGSGGNLILSDSGASDSGLYISTSNANNNHIYNNVIGLTQSQAIPSSRGYRGIYLTGNPFNSHIEKNVISGHSETGLYLAGVSSSEIIGNTIGFAADGATPRGNQLHGIHLRAGSYDNFIGTSASGGGNLIVASSEAGSYAIYITDSTTTNNYIYNNIIGLTSSEAIPTARGKEGIVLINDTNNNVIGGTAPNEGNVISGNNGDGVWITDSHYNSLLGNYIGTNSNGTAARANLADGVQISDGAIKNKIGDGTAAGRNIISGNNRGIYLTATGTSSNEILGNHIGVNATGDAALANSLQGIFLNSGASFTIIGRTGEGNVISGNGGQGIYILATDASSNEIVGNYIGVAADGTTDIGNTRTGIYLNSPYNLVGPGNIIAYNGDASFPNGVRIDGAAAIGNVVTQNPIFGNYDKGIELLNSGNGEIAAPQVITADHNGISGSTLITGSASAQLDGTIEIFKAEGDEGKSYLGTAIADSSGDWSLSVSGLASGDAIVATGTTANPQTSEFSQTKEVITTVFTQPDNMIGNLSNGSDYIGDGEYNTTGANQTRTKSIYTGASATYYINIENDAKVVDEVIIKGSASSGDWTLTYYDAKTGGSNITASIIGAGWSTGALISGESKEIRLVAQNSGLDASTIEALVTSESNTDSNTKDTVKAVTSAIPIPTDLNSFYINSPASTIVNTNFSATITALNSSGSVETNVVGTSTLSVDSGTITPETIADSSFTDGIWSGDISLGKIGARTITIANGSSTGSAIIVVMNATQEFTSTDLGIAEMTITVPAGAASAEVNITASETASPGNAPTGFSIGGKIIDITSTVTNFIKPVTVTMPITGPLVDPHVYYWNGTEWSTDGITIISYTDTSITFTTTHFTIFTVMAAAANNLVRFGPNPYNPTSGTNAKIWYWLTDDTETTIYIIDMSGRLIWKNTYLSGAAGGSAGTNNIDFDGKDQWGNTLGNGVYLYKIIQGHKSIGGGKIAIIK